ncbi:hypothetical protein [Stagnihabitans tardus]|uniref:VPLPA-CTERM sorting domain-containing protein n=1 Tax=Stagnihabitans tardus TaxID=2699202 RepID=A0AAE5BY61_9RHOB|nr:hypothetical protein [Stagnihabitans tardus]NBZ90033.1 hypothetical protein [Stagnihabitans tardus]
MLRRNILTTIIAAGALALGLASAQAAPVTFTFTGMSSGSGSTFSFTDLSSGLTLNVGSGSFNVADPLVLPPSGNNKTFTAGGSVSTQSQGLGVVLNSTPLGPTGTDKLNSSSGFRETLSFTFGQSVKLISVGFTQMFFNTTNGPIVVFEKFGANLEANSGDLATQGPDSFDPTGTINVSNPTSSLDLSTAGYVGSDFAIGAKGGTNFFLSSITVDIQPVPVPAAGLLLGGVVLLPLLRRKRRG